METFVRWSDWEGNGIEHCLVRGGPIGFCLEGVVAGTRNTLYGAHYVIQADKSFRTRLVRMYYVGGPTLHVITDGKGNWQDVISGGSIAELEGCLDVDIGVTPSTNTLPIRRLMLEQGSSADIRVAYVPLPDQIEKPFLPRPAAQRTADGVAIAAAARTWTRCQIGCCARPGPVARAAIARKKILLLCSRLCEQPFCIRFIVKSALQEIIRAFLMTYNRTLFPLGMNIA
jgi:uncharacterized protein